MKLLNILWRNIQNNFSVEHVIYTSIILVVLSLFLLLPSVLIILQIIFGYALRLIASTDIFWWLRKSTYIASASNGAETCVFILLVLFLVPTFDIPSILFSCDYYTFFVQYFCIILFLQNVYLWYGYFSICTLLGFILPIGVYLDIKKHNVKKICQFMVICLCVYLVCKILNYVNQNITINILNEYIFVSKLETNDCLIQVICTILLFVGILLLCMYIAFMTFYWWLFNMICDTNIKIVEVSKIDPYLPNTFSEYVLLTDDLINNAIKYKKMYILSKFDMYKSTLIFFSTGILTIIMMVYNKWMYCVIVFLALPIISECIIRLCYAFIHTIKIFVTSRKLDKVNV